MIQGIKLNENLRSQFSGTRYYGFYENFSQVNTFVGANNSGKSRFLRTIFSDSTNVKFLIDIDEKLKAEIVRQGKDILSSIKNLSRYGFDYKYENYIAGLIIRIENNEKVLKEILDLYWYYSTLNRDEFKARNELNFHQVNHFLSNSKTYAENLGSVIDRLGTENSKVEKIYIPILRGLRPLSKEEKLFSNRDIYLERTKHDYFKQDVPKGEIFTGLSIYEKVKSLLLGDENERNEIKEFENFLAENVFKKKINLIPKYNDDVLHIKIENEVQMPIYKLGDGLQTLIVILFPIFIQRNQRTLIFIEEPETHLHPKWQRLLFRAMSRFEKHTYFISTHSSIFINSPSNSIFIVSKKKNITNIHYSNIKTEKVEILKDLGYKPNDLFQTNYIIWVEGQSDKLYLNHFINLIDSSLVEGEDYSIMFYGGSTYKHFLENRGSLNLHFIESLNQNYALVMDSDRKKTGERYSIKKKNIVRLFEKNNAFCWLTKYREIENYIPYESFLDAVKSVHKVKNIEVDKSNFGDRCKYINLDANPSYKPSIKLSNELFSKIQKNKNGSLNGIPAKELRKEIENSISKTKKSINNIDKIKVAEKLVQKNIQIENDELSKKLTELVKDIKKANN